MTKRIVISLVVIVASLTLLLIVSWVVLAQSGGVYELSWSPPISAATKTTGGNYDLSAIAGQISAGSAGSGGEYELIGGSNGAGVSGSSLQQVFVPFIVQP
jgi:hypothetical protein